MMDNLTIIIVALIAAIPPTIVAFLSLRSSKKNSYAIQEVHLSVNSRLDALLKSEKSVSKSEGLLEGRNEAKVIN